MKINQIECGLSGVTSTEEDALDVEDYGGDDADLPEGWTKFTITHRRGNGTWEAVQEVKELTAASLLAQVAPEDRAEIEPVVMVQMEAQFAALENRPGYARTLLEEHVVFIAPHMRAEGLEAEVQALASLLGIDASAMLADDVEGDIDSADPGTDTDEEADQPAQNAEAAGG